MVSNWDPAVGNYIFYNQRVLTSISADENLPDRNNLGVYPNPFNNRCIFELQLDRHSMVELVVYDMLGRKIREIISTELAAGRHQLEWDGSNDMQQAVGSGMYIYHLVSDERRHTGKLLLLK
jgi:hypothetical protein